MRSGLVLLLAAGLLAACAGPPDSAGVDSAGAGRWTPVTSDASWAPLAREVPGGRTIAVAGQGAYVVSTASGERTFLPGINLGSTTPGHQPGELAITAEDYRRWFGLMGQFGIRAVRIYTIHPPAFYAELASYNEAHPDAPLLLMQGVYLPHDQPADLYDAPTTAAFDAEIRDAVAAVTGSLRRGRTPGRASGVWSTDVSSWVAGWIIGVEWDGAGVLGTDRTHRGQPAFAGKYFTSPSEATPTESWLAARLDGTAAAMARTGHVAPLAFVNWATTDPLSHAGWEPLAQEDLAGIDPTRVRPTAAWGAGYFASYHAYPYYPDFLRHQPDLQKPATGNGGGPADPYATYLAALRQQAGDVPVMVTEFGVPGSLGSAHFGPLGRDQGGHTEGDAMRIDAELFRLIRGAGMAGGFVFEFTDEWTKYTWNTLPRHIPAERRSLWHDPLTNEQWFGLVATDALPVATPAPITGPGAEMTSRVDASWLTLGVRVARSSAPVVLTFDVVPGESEAPPPTAAAAVPGADYAVVVDRAAGTATAYLREALDLVPADFGGDVPSTADTGAWRVQRLTTNRELTVPATGVRHPAEFLRVGELIRGEMAPSVPGYNSLASWELRADGETDILDLRLPWAFVGISDPSSRTALRVDGARTRGIPIEGLQLRASAGDASAAGTITWETWQKATSAERVKSGIQPLIDAYAELGR